METRCDFCGVSTAGALYVMCFRHRACDKCFKPEQKKQRNGKPCCICLVETPEIKKSVAYSIKWAEVNTNSSIYPHINLEETAEEVPSQEPHGTDDDLTGYNDEIECMMSVLPPNDMHGHCFSIQGILGSQTDLTPGAWIGRDAESPDALATKQDSDGNLPKSSNSTINPVRRSRSKKNLKQQASDLDISSRENSAGSSTESRCSLIAHCGSYMSTSLKTQRSAESIREYHRSKLSERRAIKIGLSRWLSEYIHPTMCSMPDLPADLPVCGGLNRPTNDQNAAEDDRSSASRLSWYNSDFTLTIEDFQDRVNHKLRDVSTYGEADDEAEREDADLADLNSKTSTINLQPPACVLRSVRHQALDKPAVHLHSSLSENGLVFHDHITDNEGLELQLYLPCFDRIAGQCQQQNWILEEWARHQQKCAGSHTNKEMTDCEKAQEVLAQQVEPATTEGNDNDSSAGCLSEPAPTERIVDLQGTIVAEKQEAAQQTTQRIAQRLEDSEQFKCEGIPDPEDFWF